MLGKGGTQKRAIEEVLALPQDHPQRQNILELVGIWRINVESKIDLDPEERELIMELSPAYIKWREDTLQEGIRQGLERGLERGLEQGVQQERRFMVEALLRTRFGELDEALLGIIKALLESSPDEFMPLCLNASREELLERFGDSGETQESWGNGDRPVFVKISELMKF